MITISVNANNDLFLDANNNLAMVTEEDALAQTCTAVSSHVRGEFLYAQQDGVNYQDFVWTTANVVSFESSLINQLQQLDGVLSVTNFTTTRDGNTLQYTLNVNTVYGVIPLNGSL